MRSDTHTHICSLVRSLFRSFVRNVDLCENCHTNQVHGRNHMFVAIPADKSLTWMSLPFLESDVGFPIKNRFADALRA